MQPETEMGGWINRPLMKVGHATSTGVPFAYTVNEKSNIRREEGIKVIRTDNVGLCPQQLSE